MGKIVGKLNFIGGVSVRNIRTAYRCYLKRLKTLPPGSVARCTRRISRSVYYGKINLLAAKFLPRCPPFCLLWFLACIKCWHFRCPKCIQQSAVRSLAIVCDHMETTLFAMVCDLRFAIRDRLRSFAIIWKPAFTVQYQCELANWKPFFCFCIWECPKWSIC